MADEGNLPEAPSFVDANSYQAGLDDTQQHGTDLALTCFANGGTRFLHADGPGIGKTRNIFAVADTYKQQTGNRALTATQNKQIIADSFTADA